MTEVKSPEQIDNQKHDIHSKLSQALKGFNSSEAEAPLQEEKLISKETLKKSISRFLSVLSAEKHEIIDNCNTHRKTRHHIQHEVDSEASAIEGAELICYMSDKIVLARVAKTISDILDIEKHEIPSKSLDTIKKLKLSTQVILWSEVNDMIENLLQIHLETEASYDFEAKVITLKDILARIKMNASLPNDIPQIGIPRQNSKKRRIS